MYPWMHKGTVYMYSILLLIIKKDKDGRDKIPFNPIDVNLLICQVFSSKLKHENFRMFLHKILNTIMSSIFCFKSWKCKRVSNLFRKHNKTNTILDVLEGDIYKHPITEVVGMSPSNSNRCHFKLNAGGLFTSFNDKLTAN